jgi:hypothetical protein
MREGGGPADDLGAGSAGSVTNVRNYENQRTQVLLPNGQRQTMIYNADFRNVRTET